MHNYDLHDRMPDISCIGKSLPQHTYAPFSWQTILVEQENVFYYKKSAGFKKYYDFTVCEHRVTTGSFVAHFCQLLIQLFMASYQTYQIRCANVLEPVLKSSMMK